MAQPLFSWIHISDIHFGHGDTEHRWDQKLVLDQLKEDLPKARSAGAPPVDALLVTGDIAFSGGGRSPTEYVDAKQWLEAMAAAANLQAKHVFLVPGNHDVNRGGDKARSVRSLLGDLRSGQDTTEASLDNVLKNEDEKALLAKRMQGYLEFAVHFAPWCNRDPLPALENRLFWRETITARGGLRVRLVGLNTALVSADEQDEGKLQLGNEQLHLALGEKPGAEELVVVLTHHPLRPWLSDGRNADSWLQSRAHVHVFGHVHEADLESIRHGAGKSFVRMVAGAAHAEKERDHVPARHGYNIAAIEQQEDGTLVLRIWPRRWSEKNKEFRADMDLLEDGQTSIAHPLPIKLDRPSKTDLATPRPPDVVPTSMIGTMPLGTVGTQWLTGELMPIWNGAKAVDSRVNFDLPGNNVELILSETRVYHVGREASRADGKKNDCVLPSPQVSQDAATLERIEGRWFVRNTSNKPRMRVNLMKVEPGQTQPLVHRTPLLIGNVAGEFRDGRFHKLAPQTAVDPHTGLMSRDGLTCEVGLALAVRKYRILLAFHFGVEDVLSACVAARALHEADPAARIGRMDATVGLLIEDKSTLAARLETVRNAGVSPVVAGYWELSGSSTEAGARMEAVLGALARIAAAGGNGELVDLAKYALQGGSVDELAQVARDARNVGGGMGLLLLDEFERHAELPGSSRAALELELREYLGALLQPSDRVAPVGEGAIGVATRQPVDRLLRDIATGWRARGAITVGKLELERSLRVVVLDENMIKQLSLQPTAFLREMGTGTNTHSLPTPIAYWLDAAQSAMSMSERAAGLVKTLDATWRLLGCMLVTAFWATKKGEPLPNAAATGTPNSVWPGIALAVAEALRAEKSRIGELAEAVCQAWKPSTGALRLATEQAASLSALLASPADARAITRATPSLEVLLNEVFSALRVLRGWALVAVRGTKPLDRHGAIRRVDCVDFSGPHVTGIRRRHTVSDMQVEQFVYVARWTEGLAIPLEPLVRYVRIPGTNIDELVFLDQLPAGPGFYSYAPVNLEGQVQLDVTERQLAR